MFASVSYVAFRTAEKAPGAVLQCTDLSNIAVVMEI